MRSLSSPSPTEQVRRAVWRCCWRALQSLTVTCVCAVVACSCRCNSVGAIGRLLQAARRPEGGTTRRRRRRCCSRRRRCWGRRRSTVIARSHARRDGVFYYKQEHLDFRTCVCVCVLCDRIMSTRAESGVVAYGTAEGPLLRRRDVIRSPGSRYVLGHHHLGGPLPLAGTHSQAMWARRSRTPHGARTRAS